MYQNIGKKAYKKDLTNSLLLDKYLEHPHKSYPSIHVAGTNGKGTTCHMLSAVLQSAGYKVGLYTSPHLKDFRERIKINGKLIDRKDVIDFVKEHKDFLVEKGFSFFEMTVGMAFQIFKNQKVDIAIIEVGLGGRLDSTNIITPILSVITSIDLDHTDILGNTLQAIATEKSGIIKANVPVVINENRLELRKLFESIANEKNSPLKFAFAKAKQNTKHNTTEDQNKQLAIKALQVINNLTEFEVSDKHLNIGFDNYRTLSSFSGRYQTLSTEPKVIVDVAHNSAGIKMLFKRIHSETFENLHVVYGSIKNKDVMEMLKFMPSSALYYLCSPNNDRGMSTQELQEPFHKTNRLYTTHNSPIDALDHAKKNSGKTDLIIVTGSTFIVSEIL